MVLSKLCQWNNSHEETCEGIMRRAYHDFRKVEVCKGKPGITNAMDILIH